MANRWATAIPFEISNYDNPETIRFRKYATGTHLVVHGTEVETGLTPKEMVWQRGEARLYQYESAREKREVPRTDPDRLRAHPSSLHSRSGAGQQLRRVPLR